MSQRVYPAVRSSHVLLPGETYGHLLYERADVAAIDASLREGRLLVVVPTGKRPQVGVLARLVYRRPVLTPGLPLPLVGLRRVRVRRFTATRPHLRAEVEPYQEPAVARAERKQLLLLRTQLKSDGFRRRSRADRQLARQRCSYRIVDRLCVSVRADRRVRARVLVADTLRERIEALKEYDDVREALDTTPVEDADELSQQELAALPEAVRQALERDEAKGYGRDRDAARAIRAITWTPEKIAPLSLAAARRELDRSHAGMDNVKEAILDYLVALEWRRRCSLPAVAGQSLCLVGPPGTGKTSIAQATASVLGRKLVRIGMAGVDDLVLVGADRSYTQSRPGIFVRVLASCGRHPSGLVFLLDEIDKVPEYETRSAVPALLALLDPEQNHAWRDHFFDELPVDLSGALFVATANDEKRICPPLRDRLVMLRLPGYSAEEQIQIGYRHILPRLKRELGIRGQVQIPKRVIRMLVEDYSAAAGMRMLRHRLNQVLVRALREHIESGATVRVTPTDVRAWLPAPQELGSSDVGGGFTLGNHSFWVDARPIDC